MRWIFFILLFFLVFPSSSTASDIYIKVTQTTNKSNLSRINSAINSLGLTATYRTTKRSYVVYSGPYESDRSASYALQKLKRYFPYAKAIRVEQKAKFIERVDTPTQQSSRQPSRKNYGEEYFARFGVGYSSIPLTHTGKFEIYLPSETGVSFDLSGGYFLKKNIFATAGYLRSDTGDIVFDNLYASINYKFKALSEFSKNMRDFRNINPYIGVTAGYSTSTWNVNPLTNQRNSASNSSNSFFGGTQIGAIYTGDKEFSLYTNYQCVYMRHSSNLTADTVTSKLQHKTLHNLQIGVQYSF